MRVVYRCLLRLLPTDFRRAFGPAMYADFAMVLCDARRHGLPRAMHVSVREYVALIRCTPREWLAKSARRRFSAT